MTVRSRTIALAVSLLALALPVRAGTADVPAKREVPPAPDWARQLVVYEIAIKGFTSPNGPESGTFESAAAKLPYLRDLGIDGIWLSGHNLADPRHFYGIWTQYATIRPDVVDPGLGGPSGLEAFVAEAHRLGIRVFLDVITHGVMNDSPLVREHPGWFRGGSWGMTDYDWTGGRADLDEWWVKTHTDYVVKHGIDGFRLDVAIYRPDLWIRIKQNAARAGHPIVVFLEGDNHCGGACDFRQRQTTLSIQTRGLDRTNSMLGDVAAYFAAKLRRPGTYLARVYYDDGSFSIGSTPPDPNLVTSVMDQMFWIPRARFHRDLEVTLLADPDPSPSNEKQAVPPGERVVLDLAGIHPDRLVERVSLSRESHWEDVWLLGGTPEKKIALTGAQRLRLSLEPRVPDVKLFSTQISAHDDGWEGFPAGSDPYVAEGSRCVFGYSGLLAPAIPLFMSGEEWNADFVPLPGLTPDLYGKGERGKGTWLYGSWLQWDQLLQPAKAAMLADVRKMIAIRRAEKEVLYARSNEEQGFILPLERRGSGAGPVPYVVWAGRRAVVVAGNDTATDATISLVLPLHTIGASGRLVVTDLWGSGRARLEGDVLTFPVRRDRVPGGGLAVHRLEWR